MTFRQKTSLRIAILVLLTSCSEEQEKTENRPPGNQEIDSGGANPASWKLSVEQGMPYQLALQLVHNFGAEEFACSYRIVGSESDRYIWFTLPNGMSIHLYGSPAKNGKLILTTLEVSNSTSLFCCKGENWFGLKALSIGDQSVSLDRETGQSDSTQNLLHIGMPVIEALKLLELASSEHTPLPKHIAKRLQEPKHWTHHQLSDHQLLLRSNKTSHVTQIVVLGIQAARSDQEEEKHWISCEVVNLSNPLKNGLGAFLKEFAWKPEQQPRSHLNANGQRR